LADVAADLDLATGAQSASNPYALARFHAFDPDAPEFIRSCIAARAGKSSG
jgi:hypothetical protein